MNVEKIKTLVDAGRTVRWSNQSYTVTKDYLGQYHIKCCLNGHCIGLTHRDGVTLNGEEKDFYLDDCD